MMNVFIVIIAIACVGLVCGGFYLANQRNVASHESGGDVSEVQKLILKEIEDSYPSTPREVVKLYNRIVKCYYAGECTDEELDKLVSQTLLLFDDELKKANPKDEYLKSVKEDIEKYSKEKKTITNTTVCASNDVMYTQDKGDSIAYVTASYFIQKNKNFDKTFQKFVLRKDSEGRWKILCFYKIEGDSSTDGN